MSIIRKKRYIAVIFVLLMAVIVGSGAGFINQSYAADTGTGDKVEVSSDTVTAYYMYLPLNSVGKMVFENSETKLNLNYHFTRRTRQVTAIVIFENVKHNGQSIFVSTNVDINIPSSWGSEYYFENDGKDDNNRKNFTINIRKSFFNFIQQEIEEKGTQHIRIIIMKDGKSATMKPRGGMFVSQHSHCFGIAGMHFSNKEVSGDVDDPNSPDFELGDNGGSTAIVKRENVFKQIGNFFKTTFNGVVDAFKSVLKGVGLTTDWLIVVGIILLGVILLYIIFKIFKKEK